MEGIKTKTNKILNLLSAPGETFKILSESKNNFIPIIIIIISGFTGGINNYVERLISYHSLKISSSSIQLLPTFMKNYYFSKPFLTDEILRNIILSVILWFLLGSLYYIVAKMLKGTPKFSNLLQLTSYAYLPLIIGNILGSITSIFNSFLSAIIPLVFGIWFFILKVYAVSTASKFSFGRGVVSVLIPTAIISILTFGVIISILISSIHI